MITPARTDLDIDDRRSIAGRLARFQNRLDDYLDGIGDQAVLVVLVSARGYATITSATDQNLLSIPAHPQLTVISSENIASRIDQALQGEFYDRILLVDDSLVNGNECRRLIELFLAASQSGGSPSLSERLNVDVLTLGVESSPSASRSEFSLQSKATTNLEAVRDTLEKRVFSNRIDEPFNVAATSNGDGESSVASWQEVMSDPVDDMILRDSVSLTFLNVDGDIDDDLIGSSDELAEFLDGLDHLVASAGRFNETRFATCTPLFLRDHHWNALQSVAGWDRVAMVTDREPGFRNVIWVPTRDQRQAVLQEYFGDGSEHALASLAVRGRISQHGSKTRLDLLPTVRLVPQTWAQARTLRSREKPGTIELGREPSDVKHHVAQAEWLCSVRLLDAFVHSLPYSVKQLLSLRSSRDDVPTRPALRVEDIERHGFGNREPVFDSSWTLVSDSNEWASETSPTVRGRSLLDALRLSSQHRNAGAKGGPFRRPTRPIVSTPSFATLTSEDECVHRERLALEAELRESSSFVTRFQCVEQESNEDNPQLAYVGQRGEGMYRALFAAAVKALVQNTDPQNVHVAQWVAHLIPRAADTRLEDVPSSSVSLAGIRQRNVEQLLNRVSGDQLLVESVPRTVNLMELIEQLCSALKAPIMDGLRYNSLTEWIDGPAATFSETMPRVSEVIAGNDELVELLDDAEKCVELMLDVAQVARRLAKHLLTDAFVDVPVPTDLRLRYHRMLVAVTGFAPATEFPLDGTFLTAHEAAPGNVNDELELVPFNAADLALSEPALVVVNDVGQELTLATTAPDALKRVLSQFSLGLLDHRIVLQWLTTPLEDLAGDTPLKTIEASQERDTVREIEDLANDANQLLVL